VRQILQEFELRFDHDPETLRRWLEKETGLCVELTLTDNSSRMLSVTGGPGAVSVRAHRVFLRAPHEVLKEVAVFVKNRRGRTPLINRYIKDEISSIKDGGDRRVVTRPLGAHHDLQSVFDGLNSECFASSVRARITWGAARPRKRARVTTIGSYSCLTGVIRINRILDSARVPRYFVAFVVYHEMLHAHMGVGMKASRRSIHPREFREKEVLFKDYKRAVEWGRSHGLDVSVPAHCVRGRALERG